MKILLLNTHEIRGGATRAAQRLFKGLQSNEQIVSLFVLKKETTDPKVIGNSSFFGKFLSKWGYQIDNLPLRFYHNRTGFFSTSCMPSNSISYISRQTPDIVHLHWVSDSFIQIEQMIQIKRPIVWTLHDAWAFTGGCHYPGKCENFLHECGSCPLLSSKIVNDVSRWIYSRKKKIWPKLDLTIITPSQWLGQMARKSSLLCDFRVECIPNGIDINKFKPMAKIAARNLLGLPLDKKLIGFGAMSAISDKRKGFHLLLQSLKRLADEKIKDTEVIIFGEERTSNSSDFGFSTHYYGQLHDDFSLIALYSAIDVFAAPSLEENLSNSVMESLACGSPVIAFDIGGMPDMIEHQVNGYLAKPYSIEDFSDGIKFILKDKARWVGMSEQARKKITSEFEISVIVKRHVSLYQEIFDKDLELRSY